MNDAIRLLEAQRRWAGVVRERAALVQRVRRARREHLSLTANPLPLAARVTLPAYTGTGFMVAMASWGPPVYHLPRA